MYGNRLKPRTEPKMLKRQKVVLALLDGAGKPLSNTKFVKLLFLLRYEHPLTNDQTFYDFVPYKYGPFSFSLYRELSTLRRDGYISDDEKCIALSSRIQSKVREKAFELPSLHREAVERVIAVNIGKSQDDLVRTVYQRYPWFAQRTELCNLVPKKVPLRPRADIAIYTVGYEGKSIDGFFNGLLESGIHAIIDVRANPVSRKYGFAKRSMSDIARKLEIDYHHIPELGIPSGDRAGLSDYDSYQRLLDRYESEMLPKRQSVIARAIELMRQKPSAYLCMEKDVTCCHRDRLAKRASTISKLRIVHV